MYRLPSSQFKVVIPLIADLRYNLMIDSIMDGNTSAVIYTDREFDPQLCLIWNCNETIILSGVPVTGSDLGSVRDILLGEIIPGARRGGTPWMILQSKPNFWEREMERLLAGLEFQLAWRRFYNDCSIKDDGRTELPKEMKLRAIDSGLLQNQHHETPSNIAECVKSYWGREIKFLRTGFGYGLVQNNVVISWCLTLYASGSHFEFGVETVPGHRGQGYASRLAAACVEHCLQRGWTPHWHCWEDDRAAIAIAQKVGFSKAMKYRVIRLALKQRV